MDQADVNICIKFNEKFLLFLGWRKQKNIQISWIDVAWDKVFPECLDKARRYEKIDSK